MSTKLERIDALVREVNRGTYPTVEDLCRKFEIKERTFFDDVRFIKERLRIEIKFDYSRGGYFNSTPERKLPQFDLNEEELAALALGKEMLMKHSGTAFRQPLEEALAKIEGRIANKELAVEELKSLIRIVPGGIAESNGKLLKEIKFACDEQRSIEIEYYAANTGQTSTRKIDPYRILEHKGAWYVAGWCHQRAAMRTFAIHRIRKLNLLKDHYAIREGLDVEDWIQSAFLLEHGDGEHVVRIKFTPVGARYAIDREWHPSQKIHTHPDGSCTLEFKTQSLDEIKRWVLPFGAGAEVIDPPELRQRVMDELRMTLRGYGES